MISWFFPFFPEPGDSEFYGYTSSIKWVINISPDRGWSSRLVRGPEYEEHDFPDEVESGKNIYLDFGARRSDLEGRGKAFGADIVIKKPCFPDELVKKVKEGLMQ